MHAIDPGETTVRGPAWPSAEPELQWRPDKPRAHHQAPRRPPQNAADPGRQIRAVMKAHRRRDRISQWLVQLTARVGWQIGSWARAEIERIMAA